VYSDRESVEPIIVQNHYSRTLPKNSKHHFIVKYKGEVHGAISLGYGIRPANKTSFGDIRQNEYMEFDRMWLSDDPPHNSETLVIKLLKKAIRIIEPNVYFLISYSDGTVGNIGTIYKASNFKELPPIKADFYILKDGTRVHPVSMYHRHKTRAWAFLQEKYDGIRKAEGVQHRFILQIRRKKVAA
jgi:hypothetical protein